MRSSRATAVTAGNAADGEPVEELIADMLSTKSATTTTAPESADNLSSEPEALARTSVDPSGAVSKASDKPTTPQVVSTVPRSDPENAEEASESSSTDELATPARYDSAKRVVLDVSARLRHFLVTFGVLVGILEAPRPTVVPTTKIPDADANGADVHALASQLQPAVYGDCAYGIAKILSMLDAAGIEAMTRVQRPASRLGCFAQDEFAIDLGAGTAVCPAGKTAAIKPRKDGSRIA